MVLVLVLALVLLLVLVLAVDDVVSPLGMFLARIHPIQPHRPALVLVLLLRCPEERQDQNGRKQVKHKG